MPHQLVTARFRRMLRQPVPDGMLDLERVAGLAGAAGLTLTQASLLLDADSRWQRLFLDADGCVVAARGTRADCGAAEPCQVAWRRLGSARPPLAA